MNSNLNSVVRSAGLIALSIVVFTPALRTQASGSLETAAGRKSRDGVRSQATSSGSLGGPAEDNFTDGSKTGGSAVRVQACNYSIAPTSIVVGPGQGIGSVGVTAPDGCDWNATSNDEWLVITTGNAGSGDGKFTYFVDTNEGSASREGTITIADLTFTLHQNALEPLAILTPPLPFAVKDAFYFQTFSGMGGIGPYSWAVASGALPPGLSVDSAGRLSGTPTEPGNFAFAIEMTDHGGRKKQAGYSIDVFGAASMY